jgi:hypothetical protein
MQDIYRYVTATLREMHELGLPHGDISPNNIIFDRADGIITAAQVTLIDPSVDNQTNVTDCISETVLSAMTTPCAIADPSISRNAVLRERISTLLTQLPLCSLRDRIAAAAVFQKAQDLDELIALAHGQKTFGLHEPNASVDLCGVLQESSCAESPRRSTLFDFKQATDVDEQPDDEFRCIFTPSRRRRLPSTDLLPSPCSDDCESPGKRPKSSLPRKLF